MVKTINNITAEEVKGMKESDVAIILEVILVKLKELEIRLKILEKV